MKVFKVLLILTVSFIGFRFSAAQEMAKAELIDELGNTNCEDLIARQDRLINLLQNDPTAVGYAIIYEDESDARKAWTHKWFIEGQTDFRKFDENRLIVLKGKSDYDLMIQFWKVSAGAEKPKFDETEWDFALSGREKSHVFNSSKWDVNPCPNGLQLRNYSGYLSANPSFRGHIVIFTRSGDAFQKEKSRLLNKLTTDYNLSPDRLRFFFVKQKTDHADYELWLVPRKRR